MIIGGTEQTSRTRQSSAVLRWPDYALTFGATWEITQLAWHKSCFYFGGNQLADVGGRELSWTTLKGLRGNSKCGSEEFGHWR